MSETTPTSKGQVTIPADIRKAMGLVAGERWVFTQLDEGTPVMRAKTREFVRPQHAPIWTLDGAAARLPGVALIAHRY